MKHWLLFAGVQFALVIITPITSCQCAVVVVNRTWTSFCQSVMVVVNRTLTFVSLLQSVKHWTTFCHFANVIDEIALLFSRINIVWWLLFWYPFHPRITEEIHKRLWSFCQKCRCQVTAEYAHTLDPMSQSGVTLLSRYCVATHYGNKLTCNLPGMLV